MLNALVLDELVLWLHLGCTVEERAMTQEVRVSVEFRFHETPAGATSDRLEDTVCYARVSSAIQEHCGAKHFNLIERIGREVYEVARAVSGPGVDIGVSIHKVRPPVQAIRGGTRFRCGDFLS